MRVESFYSQKVARLVEHLMPPVVVSVRVPIGLMKSKGFLVQGVGRALHALYWR